MQQQKVWKGLQACVRKMAHAPFLLEITGEQNLSQMWQAVVAKQFETIDFQRG